MDAGIDVWDLELLHARPWPWLRMHILGLCTKPQQLGPMGDPVPATRVQALIASLRPPAQHAAAM